MIFAYLLANLVYFSLVLTFVARIRIEELLCFSVNLFLYVSVSQNHKSNLPELTNIFS